MMKNMFSECVPFQCSSVGVAFVAGEVNVKKRAQVEARQPKRLSIKEVVSGLIVIVSWIDARDEMSRALRECRRDDGASRRYDYYESERTC